jgi:hypothetical protein
MKVLIKERWVSEPQLENRASERAAMRDEGLCSEQPRLSENRLVMRSPCTIREVQFVDRTAEHGVSLSEVKRSAGDATWLADGLRSRHKNSQSDPQLLPGCAHAGTGSHVTARQHGLCLQRCANEAPGHGRHRLRQWQRSTSNGSSPGESPAPGRARQSWWWAINRAGASNAKHRDPPRAFQNSITTTLRPTQSSPQPQLASPGSRVLAHRESPSPCAPTTPR